MTRSIVKERDPARISRFELFRLFIWRRWKILLLAVFSLIGAYDLIISQLIPQAWAERLPRVIDLC